MTSNRIFFAATMEAFKIRICEQLADNSVRGMLWSKLTKADRRRGQELVKLLAPSPSTLASAGACAWKSANTPKSSDVAKALDDFVAAMERRHGKEIWR